MQYFIDYRRRYLDMIFRVLLVSIKTTIMNQKYPNINHHLLLITIKSHASGFKSR